MKIFRKQYHPPGTAPGTLNSSGLSSNADKRPIKVDVVNYSSHEIQTYLDTKVEDCANHLSTDGITWVHISGAIDPETLKHMGDLLNLHPLALEDVINHGQRPKIHTYDQHLFVVINMPVVAEDDVHIEQVSLFCGDGYVLSFHDQYDESTYKLLHERLKRNANHMRSNGSDYLLYVLIDLIVDSAFPVLELFAEQLESIEASLIEGDTKSTLHRIHNVKRELILLRRALWPQREVINSLLREETPFISDGTQPYIRDCYDHTIQIMELIESYRDMATSTLDVYLSTVSFRLNEVMRFLTVISTVFIPPTFLVGVYGMNFKTDVGVWNMPELSWPLGYLMVWGLIVVMMVSMLSYFKHKRWV